MVKTVHCDREFKSQMDQVKDDLDVTVNLRATDDHVPQAEHNNRVIVEQVWVTFHCLPYKAMPQVMLHHLAMVCTSQLKLFPVKGGVSPTTALI